MRYEVDLSTNINQMLRNGNGICPFFSSFHFYNSPFYFDEEDYFDVPIGQKYMRQLIYDDSVHLSPLFRILFQGFISAEYKFITNYIPQKSHEERLTGHLVSELENALCIVKDTFERKAFEFYGTNVPLEFAYTDLSTNNREKETGADLGLLFHINLPDFPEVSNVSAIQAKKLDDNARIDTSQIDQLVNTYQDRSFYLFYDLNPQRCSPLIQNANSIKCKIQSNKNNDANTNYSLWKREEVLCDSYQRAIPLSVFLLWNMLNPYKKAQKQFSSIWEAKNYILYGNKKNNNIKYDTYSFSYEYSQPSRILTVSVGNNVFNDLHSLDELF